MVVFFNRGQIFDALQALASCGFIIGAMAMGLAARVLSARESAVACPMRCPAMAMRPEGEHHPRDKFPATRSLK
jgi:hypothetical protein